MKILILRFKNINSLSGEFEIDFTNPQYNAEGLFLITGPTGTGKSSILDAICIALYGKTPRISSLTLSTNEVMSIGTADCYAEVHFEVNGTKYLSRFSQTKTKKGVLSTPKYLLENLSENKVLATKKTEWDTQINQISGMDFSRFVQSVLLAQGEFKKFLEANATERATLLEKITGGEIYKKISKAVFERHKQEEEKLTAINKEANLIQIMSEEAKAESKQIIKECKEKKKTLNKRETEMQKAAEWLKACATAEAVLKQLQDSLSVIQNEEREFRSERVRLQSALTAKNFEKDYIIIEEGERQLKDTEKAYEESAVALESLRTDLDSSAARLQEAETTAALSKAALDALKKLLPRVIELDSDLKSAGKQKAEKESMLSELQKKLTSLEQQLQSIRDAILQNEQQMDEIRLYQEENDSDRLLGSELSLISSKADEALKIKNQIDELKKKRDEAGVEIAEYEKQNPEDTSIAEGYQHLIDDAETRFGQQDETRMAVGDLGSLHKKKEGLQNQISTAENGISLCKELAAKNDTIRNLNSEIAAMKEEQSRLDAEIAAAEMNVVGEKEALRIQREKVKYAEIRSSLIPGGECPVCGSSHHPYKEEEESSGTDDLAVLNELEANFTKLEENIQELKTNKIKVESETKIQLKEQERLRKEVEALGQNLSEIKEKLLLQDTDTLHEDIVKLHSGYQIELTSVSENIQIVQEHQKIWEHAQSARIALAEYRQKLNSYVSGLKQLRLGDEQLQKDITGKLKELEAIITTLTELATRFRFDQGTILESGVDSLRERVKLWDEKSKELTGLQQELVKQKQSLESAEEQYHEQKTQLIQFEQQLQIVQESYATLTNERRELFGNKNPESERERLEAELGMKSNRVQELKNAIAKLEGSIGEKQSQMDRLQKEKTALKQKIKNLITQFEEKIRTVGIVSIADFRELLIPDEELRDLQKQAKALDDQFSEAKSRISSKQEETETLREKRVTEQSIAEVEETLEQLRTEADDTIRQISQQEERLKQDEKNCALLAEKQKLADAQSAILQNWKKLNELIGQASGDKFNKIAQGMIFNRLLAYANKSLSQIMRRYELRKSGNDGLDISVVDYDNAGSERPVKNLSGGESFIVSLALALGLSNMASSRVRIDSLFLDEGFGTLDDEVLETALTTLSDLRAGGKLIGIISHIDKIKERIPVKLEVRRVREGVSTISGPGVRVG